jgi:LacI family transcriptional regulator
MLSSKKSKATRAATLADVGRAAGVSAMAASTVLNGAQTSSRIAAATRERILRAASRLHYRPNGAARALANRRMNTLGVATVLLGRELNHYFLEIFNGILAGAAQRQQNATVFTLQDWDRDAARLNAMCDGRIDGLILVAPRLTREAAKLLPVHTPFVALHANSPLPNVICIGSDEERGACEMVRHLIAQGHRRILHITGPAPLMGVQRRVRGYKAALAQARIRFESELLVEASYSTEAGRTAMRNWLRQREGEPLPHAIFGGNDAIAVGCIEALAEVGLRVPDDISVAGFDDSSAARTAVPQLTTVRQPLRLMGERAVRELLAQIDGDRAPTDVPPEPVIYPADLVLRASVGAPPAAPRMVPAATVRRA